jgi:hypothetical protein
MIASTTLPLSDSEFRVSGKKLSRTLETPHRSHSTGAALLSPLTFRKSLNTTTVAITFCHSNAQPVNSPGVRSRWTLRLACLNMCASRRTTVRRTIKCPMCGEHFPLPSELQRPNLRSISKNGNTQLPEDLLRLRDLVLNAATHDVWRGGREIALNPTEFRLLESLMRSSGQAVSRKVLANSIWDSNDHAGENLHDVTISHLRQKVDRDHKVKLIKTVRKLGYAIRGPAHPP